MIDCVTLFFRFGLSCQSKRTLTNGRTADPRAGIRRIESVSSHGHSALPREDCGRGRRQLDRPSAPVCQRDAVDPLPAGGVCGQCVGVLQRGDRAHIHVLFSAVHFAVSSNDYDVYHFDIHVIISSNTHLCYLSICLSI